MKIDALIVLMMVSAVGLSGGCSRNQPPADSLPNPAPAAASDASTAASAADKAPPANALADFSVEPGVVHACDGQDRVVSTVKWQVKDPAVATVKVEVDSTEDATRKTFTAGGATGEAQTGDWVGAGVRFHLIDAASGKELATHEVTSLPCEG